jgi:hypothetical protein
MIIILKGACKVRTGLAQNRKAWLIVAKTTMNLRILLKTGIPSPLGPL